MPRSTQLVGAATARYQQRERDLAAAREMLDDPEMAEMAHEEIAGAEAELAALEAELQAALLPQATRTTSATPSSRSAPAPAATNRRCSPATCCACTCATPSAAAGAPRS